MKQFKSIVSYLIFICRYRTIQFFSIKILLYIMINSLKKEYLLIDPKTTYHYSLFFSNFVFVKLGGLFYCEITNAFNRGF